MTALKLITRNYRVNESRQRGASLLEGIAYLGIAAIVILGAVSLLTGAFGSAQSNR
ncbi:MAG: pilus assembly protein, partial [Herminiimonas sp.]|nr:pilus assembly protein [Herminiimonas sp.]